MSVDDQVLQDRVRRAFEAQERHAQPPAFNELWRDQPGPRSIGTGALLAGAAIASVFAVLVLVDREPRPEPFPSLGAEITAAGLWRSPTDVALATTQQPIDSLRDVPRVTLPDAPPLWPFSES